MTEAPNLSSKGLIARLTKVRDGYTVPQADDPRDSPWNVLNEAAATLERVESENETLRLAICGGEDAPGYAVSLPLEMILGVLRDNYTSWRRAEAQVEALRTLLRQAFDSRAPDYAEQAHPGWYDRALAALSVPAEERRAAALSDLAAQDAEEIFGPTTALDVALQALADAGVDGVPPEALAAAIEAARVAAGWGRSSPSESSLRTPPEWYGQQTDESGDQAELIKELRHRAEVAEAAAAAMAEQRDQWKAHAGFLWTAPDVDMWGQVAERKGVFIRDKINGLLRRAVRAEGRADTLAQVLEDVRAAIVEHAPDTLWVSLIETAVDCIDAALSAPGSAPARAESSAQAPADVLATLTEAKRICNQIATVRRAIGPVATQAQTAAHMIADAIAQLSAAAPAEARAVYPARSIAIEMILTAYENLGPAADPAAAVAHLCKLLRETLGLPTPPKAEAGHG